MQKKFTVCLLILSTSALLLPGCKSNKEHDHLFGAWESTKAASCTLTGKEKRTCVVCGKAETRESHLAPHNFNTDNICKECGFELQYNDHLQYTLSADGSSYILSGRGENGSTEVVVPYYYEGKPVTEIKEDCFLSSAVTSFEIQNSVKKIGARAFNSCDALQSFYCYDSVEEIGNFAFANCTSLKSVRLSENMTKLDELFYGCTSLESVEIGSKTREITDLSFYKCASLKSVNLPVSLTRLGTMAFSETGITSITVPSGVTAMERGLFIKCSALERVTMLGAVSSIGGDEFEECPAFQKFILYSLPKDEWRKMDKSVFWEGEGCGEFSVIFKDGKLSFDEVKTQQ